MASLDSVPIEVIKATQKELLNSLDARQRNYFGEFVRGERVFFKFPPTGYYNNNFRNSGAPEPWLKQEAQVRLLAVRDFVGGYETAYTSENRGEFLREVTPKDQTQIGSQGEKHLPYHSDMGYLRFPGEDDHPNEVCSPDYLVLSCVHNEERVSTYIVDIDTIQRELDELTGENLKQNWFSFESPDSVKPLKKYVSRPIVKAHPSGRDLIRWENCLPSNLSAASPFAKTYLFLEDLNIGQKIDLEPGETLVFDNRRCLHGRPAIPAPTTKAGRRLLLRLYVNKPDTPLHQASGAKKYVQEG